MILKWFSPCDFIWWLKNWRNLQQKKLKNLTQLMPLVFSSPSKWYVLIKSLIRPHFRGRFFTSFCLSAYPFRYLWTKFCFIFVSNNGFLHSYLRLLPYNYTFTLYLSLFVILVFVLPKVTVRSLCLSFFLLSLWLSIHLESTIMSTSSSAVALFLWFASLLRYLYVILFTLHLLGHLPLF